VKTRQLIARSLRQHFNAAVMIVAYPSGNAEGMRLAFDEPAEADALNASRTRKRRVWTGFSESLMGTRVRCDGPDDTQASSDPSTARALRFAAFSLRSG